MTNFCIRNNIKKKRNIGLEIILYRPQFNFSYKECLHTSLFCSLVLKVNKVPCVVLSCVVLVFMVLSRPWS